MHQVWDAIKLGWAELEAWIGFLLDWEGIIDTQKAIHSWMSTSLNQLNTELKTNNVNLNGYAYHVLFLSST
jgi:hypothetical protein